MVKKAADEPKRLIAGNVLMTRNGLCTALSTGSVRGEEQAKYLVGREISAAVRPDRWWIIEFAIGEGYLSE
jgi:hypothetical protein